MARVINFTRNTIVPIEFKDQNGDLIEKFEFDKSDEGMAKLNDTQNKMLAVIAQSESKPEEFTSEQLLSEMKPIVDEMFGENAGERLHKMAGNWETFLNCFVTMCVEVRMEINQSELNTVKQTQALLNQYLNE